MVYVIVVVVVLVIAAGTIIVLKRGSNVDTTTESAIDAPTPRPAAAPMTGLESALAQVTDRNGNPIRDRIDAESKHVDDLRVPDDTGPLLRRALDHVEHPGERSAAQPVEPAADQPEAQPDSPAETPDGD